MSNEMDLHSIKNVARYETSRFLASLYFVLIALAVILPLAISSPIWKFVILAAIFIAAIAPPLSALRRYLKLRSLRKAQLEEFRKGAD